MSAPLDSEDLVDVLSDLQHDLGKYIAMPLTWLPADADAEAVKVAVRKALLQTLRGPSGHRSAAQIWAECVEEAGERLATHYPAEFESLRETIERALAWSARLSEPIDRAQITADLTAISPAVRALIDTVNHPVRTTDG